jgi:alpha-ketoglutarate-dependent taurine dioxygenase
MDTFHTADRREFEEACKELGAELTWDHRSESALLSHDLPAIRQHPVTGEKAWHNAVTLYMLTPKMHGRLKVKFYELVYPNPLERPFHMTFATGEPIPPAYVDDISETIDASTVKFPWQKGDLLVIDNYAVAHGRQPYKGPRRILAAMA